MEYEVAELETDGYSVTQEDHSGRVALRVKAQINGRLRELLIRYPDLYPYTRFEVIAPVDLGFYKHQNPYLGNLCLLDRSTAAWNVDDTAARILAQQLPKVEAANASAEPRPDLEVPQAEPVSTYFDPISAADSLIVTSREAHSVLGDRGTLEVVLGERGLPVRGYVAAINGRPAKPPFTGKVFGLRNQRSVAVEWVRLKAPPATTDANVLIPDLIANRLMKAPQIGNGQDALTAITFPQEVAYGEAKENAWIFVYWIAANDHVIAHYVRTERYESAQQGLRIPHLGGLRERRITLFGVGGVGAAIAHHLLQMRIGHLRIIDYDLVRLGNAVRWPLGFGAAGMKKGAALKNLADEHFPETTVTYQDWHVGQSVFGSSQDERELLECALDSDLVIDATAELGVQLLLADAARTRIPLITVEAREGGYGGIIGRYRPDQEGCYRCFKLRQADGQFVVPFDQTGRAQPRGCADPTFTGASFDLAPLSAATARIAAQTLVPSKAFPDAEFDLALLFNRSVDDNKPRWEYHRLDPHPSCQSCTTS